MLPQYFPLNILDIIKLEHSGVLGVLLSVEITSWLKFSFVEAWEIRDTTVDVSVKKYRKRESWDTLVWDSFGTNMTTLCYLGRIFRKIYGFHWLLLECVDQLSAVYERKTRRMLSEKWTTVWLKSECLALHTAGSKVALPEANCTVDTF